jgi:hypothetical protein
MRTDRHGQTYMRSFSHTVQRIHNEVKLNELLINKYDQLYVPVIFNHTTFHNYERFPYKQTRMLRYIELRILN